MKTGSNVVRPSELINRQEGGFLVELNNMIKKYYKQFAWASFILGIINLSGFFPPRYVAKTLNIYNADTLLRVYAIPVILGIVFGIFALRESIIEKTSNTVKLAIVGILLNMLLPLAIWFMLWLL